MKSYCSRNNLVAMGWFLVILGLVITSGVDSQSSFVSRALNWIDTIVKEQNQNPTYKGFVMKNGLIRRRPKLRNKKEVCAYIIKLEKEYSEEQSSSIPLYQTFHRLADHCRNKYGPWRNLAVPPPPPLINYGRSSSSRRNSLLGKGWMFILFLVLIMSMVV